MDNQSLSPEQIIAAFMESRMALYKSRDSYEAVLKNYHDRSDVLIQVVQAYQKRLLELEEEVKTLKSKDGSNKK